MVGTKVFVYFNLHKKMFSVKDVKTGRVVLHTNKLILENAKFKVSQAGRKRVLEQRRKNVHAGVQGILKAYENVEVDPNNYNKAYYNPYKTETFVDLETGQPVQESEEVLMVDKKVFYK